MSSSSKLTLQDFLPFPELEDTNSSQDKIGVETAKIFMQGVKDNIIPNKVISALGSKYMDDIINLTKDK